MKQSANIYLLPTEYTPKNEILSCDCVGQQCCGKFLKLKSWQFCCQWECVRLGLATDMTLKNNIYEENKTTKNKKKSVNQSDGNGFDAYWEREESMSCEIGIDEPSETY